MVPLAKGFKLLRAMPQAASLLRREKLTMYAIIMTGGKQYKVSEGDIISVEKLGLELGEKVVFDQVVAVSNGDALTIGEPVVNGASVEATVIENFKGKKIRIFKYKPKKGYRKRQGHRQALTKVVIGKING